MSDVPLGRSQRWVTHPRWCPPLPPGHGPVSLTPWFDEPCCDERDSARLSRAGWAPIISKSWSVGRGGGRRAAARHFDEPFADSLRVPMLRLSQAPGSASPSLWPATGDEMLPAIADTGHLPKHPPGDLSWLAARSTAGVPPGCTLRRLAAPQAAGQDHLAQPCLRRHYRSPRKRFARAAPCRICCFVQKSGSKPLDTPVTRAVICSRDALSC